MCEVQNEIVISFTYKEKYCREDPLNYKYYKPITTTNRNYNNDDDEEEDHNTNINTNHGGIIKENNNYNSNNNNNNNNNNMTEINEDENDLINKNNINTNSDFTKANKNRPSYCYQWKAEDECFQENTLIFSDIRTYTLPEVSQALGCISCCKECSPSAYVNDLLSLKPKRISNTSQKTDEGYRLLTFRHRETTTDYPLLYHPKTQSLHYCSVVHPASNCSRSYTCFPVARSSSSSAMISSSSPRTITSHEMDNDVPDFANIIFILLFIVIVVSVIALIWIVIYVIRTYQRHKKMNQVADENDGEEQDQEIYDSQDEKEYLSDNYDYVYKPSEDKQNERTFVKLKTDA